MGFLASFAIWAGFFLISYLMRDEPDFGDRPDTDFKAPTAKEGSPVPFIWGRTRVDAPNVIWYRAELGERADPDEYEDKFFWNSTIQFAIGLPMMEGVSYDADDPTTAASLHSIWMGDRLIWTGEIYDTELVAFSDPAFLGGPEDETPDGGYGGEFEGPIVFHQGTFTQGRDKYVEDIWEAEWHAENPLLNPPAAYSTIPAYRGLINIVFNRMLTGPNGSIQKAAFEVQSTMDPLGLGSPTANGDANPAEVIYDLIVNPWGRAGLPAARVDSASFIAAGAVLDTEGQGYSLTQYGALDAGALISNVLKEIDAVLYEDIADHTIKLQLIRADYTPADLVVYDESDIEQVDEYTVMLWKDTLNQVRLDYTNREDGYKTRSVFAQDMANIAIQDGQKKATTVAYPGICDIETANKVVARELKAGSLPLAKLRLVINRNATSLRPGSVFKFSWSEFGIVEMILRVVRFDLGSLDSNFVTIECVQDRFATSFQIFDTQDPIQPVAEVGPGAVTDDAVIETPWYLGYLAQQQGVVADPELPRLFYMAVKPDVYSATFAGQPSEDGETFVADKSGMFFADTAAVETSYSKLLEPYDTTTGLRIDGLTDASILQSAADTSIQQFGLNLIYIDDEFMAYETFTAEGGGVYTLNNVWRGLLDTVPAAHAANAPVYFARSQNLSPLGQTVFDGDEDLDIKLITRNMNLTLPPLEAPIIDLQLADRARSPVRPQGLVMDQDLVAGTNDPGTITENQALVEWMRRERDNGIVNRGDEPDDAETGTVYDVDCKVERDTDWTELSGSVDDDSDYSEFQVMGHGPAELRVDAKFPITGGYRTAFQKPTIDFVMARYRQLLLNPSFDGDALTGALDHWTTDSGSPVVTAANPLDVRGFSVSAATTWAISQVVEIDKFDPVGLQARLRFYGYGDGVGTFTVTITALNAADASLGSVNTGSLTPAAAWTAYDLAYAALPATTAKLQVTLAKTLTAHVSQFDEFDLRIGDHTAQLLLNPQFNVNTASWTVASGTWAVTTPPFEGASALYASSTGTNQEIYQEVLLPTGYDRGTAWLKGWVAAIIGTTGVTGTLHLVAMNGAAVLGSANTGVLSPTIDSLWRDSDLYLDIPDNADRLRIRWIVTNTVSVSLRLDDLQLVVFKDLHPDEHDDTVDFTEPTEQSWPATQLAWEDLGVDAPIAIWPFDLEDIEDVVWSNEQNVTIDGNSLEKTAGGSAWGDAGAVSSRSLFGNCYAETTVAETDKRRMIGLSNGDLDYHFNTIDFAIYLNSDGTFDVYESAFEVYVGGAYQTGDVFRVQCLRGVVTYWRNGELFYTSVAAVTFPLLVDCSLYHVGATLTNVEFDSGPEIVDRVNDNFESKYNLDRRGGYPATVAGFYDGTDLINKAGLEVAAGDISGAEFHSISQLSIDGSNSFALTVALRAHDAAASYTPIMGSLKTGQGWTVGMSTAGAIRASVVSTLATQNLDLSEDHGGAVPHYVTFQYNATTGFFRVWTDIDIAAAIVVPATGVMTNLARAIIGCDPTTGGLDAQFAYGILHVASAAEDLVQADTDSWWNTAQDPSLFIDTYAPDDIIVGAIDSDTDGIVLGSFCPDQIAILYNAGLTDDRGLSMHQAQDNLVDPNPNSAAWVEEGSPNVYQRAGLDAERFQRSTQVSTDNVDAYRPPAIALGANDVTVAWYAKGDSVHNARLIMWDDVKGVSIIHDYAVTASWQRFQHTFAWAASTATFELWFHGSDDGTERVIELSAPVGVYNADYAPFAIHPRTGAISAAACSLNNVLPDEFNEEGEVSVIGICATDEPGVKTVIQIDNGSDTNDLRLLYSNGAGSAFFAHRDGAGAVQYHSDVSTWEAEWTHRGRWNFGGLLEDRTYFSVGSYNALDSYGRVATFSSTAVVVDEIDLGDIEGLISKVRLTSRELPH